jgi:hypothetical protein
MRKTVLLLTPFRVSAALIVAGVSLAVLLVLVVLLAAPDDALAEDTDTTAPQPPYIDDFYSGLDWRSAVLNKDTSKGTLDFYGYASELGGTVDLFEGQQKVGTSTVHEATDFEPGYGEYTYYWWSIRLQGVSEGTHTYYATHTDAAGNTSLPSEPFTVEVFVPPRVATTVPAADATAVSRGTNVVAYFSEQMDTSTLTKETFKLYKMTSTGPVEITNVTVSPSLDGTKVTLNPFGRSEKLLARGTTYRAKVTTYAKDLAGYRLDQVLCVEFSYVWCAGLQPKVWSFKTKN